MSEIAPRFVIAQSWWIASEIVRRHPELRLIETHPGGGLYDCLTIVGPGPHPASLIQLNRQGRIHVSARAEFEPIEWQEVLRSADAHDVVRRLEAGAGFRSPTTTPASTPAVLGYRVISRVLSSLVNDKRQWDARNGQLDSADGAFEPNPQLQQFPTVREAASQRRADDILGQPHYRFWVLSGDAEPLAVVDSDGGLHLRDRPHVRLPRLYRESGRSLTALIASVFGSFLP
ncbi:hypothetical protein GCM10009609_43850 [Pseudonocardia aurantiaca]|uniref:T3SS peptide-binding chaperone domain-containing protein n=1 Tax=Pseudonocardia aurantiaca TaxID=75290 RepID=A0ABW4FY73_9PSEU